MSKLLRVLIVEDSEDDALLIKRILEREEYNLKWKRVDSASAMKEALKRQTWDIIISDYSMPQFSGIAALEIVKNLGLDLPFILVSGTIGEEAAVNAMRTGAHDYIMKDNLKRLAPAIERELREANIRKKQREAEKALRESEASLVVAQRIANLGNWDWDIINNKLLFSDETYRILGQSPQELRPTYEAFLNSVHPDDREFVKERVNDALYKNKIYSIDHRIVLPDGIERVVHGQAEVFFDETKKPIRMVGTIQDITERKRVEEQILTSLKEKEVLLQEVHHRVKNNMQLISSLLNLQSSQIKDKKALEALKSSQNRVRSMALIHERVYQSKDFARVNFSDYAQSLSSHLLSSYGIDPQVIKLNLDIKDVFLDINTAIPCSLIINELVSNSLKHAFPEGKKGEIEIVAHLLNENETEFVVSDNGVGIPKEVDFRETESLGLHLVTILVEDQLHGDIKLDRAKGTSFCIRFKKKK